MQDTGDMLSAPGSRSPGGGNGNPLLCSCLKNPLDRGAWMATAQNHKESERTESVCMCVRACTHTHTHTHGVAFGID